MMWLPLLLSLQAPVPPTVTITVVAPPPPASSAVAVATAAAAPLPPRCTACHGAIGWGDGPAGLGMTPPLSSFSDAWWQSSRTDAQLAQVIHHGGKALGMSPLMPAFPGFSEVEVASLVSTIRSLAKPGTVVARISMTGQQNRFVVAPIDKPMVVPAGSRVLIRAGQHSCDVTATTNTTCALVAAPRTP